jgi:hypothetical protein
MSGPDSDAPADGPIVVRRTSTRFRQLAGWCEIGFALLLLVTAGSMSLWLALPTALFGAALLLFFSQVEIDAAGRTVTWIWGVGAPLYRSQEPLPAVSLVTTQLEQRRGRRGSIVDMAVDMAFVNFPVRLQFEDGETLELDAPRDLHAARRLARRVARRFRVGVSEKIEGERRELAWETFDLPLIERLLRSGYIPMVPAAPAGQRVEARRGDGGELIVETRRRGVDAWDLPDVVLLGCLWLVEVPLYLFIEEADRALTRGLWIFVAVACGLPLLHFSLKVVRRWMTRLSFTVQGDGLRVLVDDPLFGKGVELAAGQLEELSVQQPYGERVPLLLVETDAKTLLLGDGFSQEELWWIRALLLEELVLNAGQWPQAGGEVRAG